MCTTHKSSRQISGFSALQHCRFEGRELELARRDAGRCAFPLDVVANCPLHGVFCVPWRFIKGKVIEFLLRYTVKARSLPFALGKFSFLLGRATIMEVVIVGVPAFRSHPSIAQVWPWYVVTHRRPCRSLACTN